MSHSHKSEDAALKWILEVEAEGASFEALAAPGNEFRSLDSALAKTLLRLAEGTVLGKELSIETERMAKAGGRLIRGRQALFLIYQSYRVEEKAGSTYALVDLMGVKMKGQNCVSSSLSGMRK